MADRNMNVARRHVRVNAYARESAKEKRARIKVAVFEIRSERELGLERSLRSRPHKTVLEGASASAKESPKLPHSNTQYTSVCLCPCINVIIVMFRDRSRYNQKKPKKQKKVVKSNDIYCGVDVFRNTPLERRR